MYNKFYRIVTLCLLLAFFTACVPIQPVASTTDAAPLASDLAAKLANAMSAAPPAIAKDATILDWPTEGSTEMVLLRQGSNQWVCYTDWPATPGNDPQCNDPVWEAFSAALGAGEAPNISGPGIAYMLAGGSDPSNSDPMAMTPAAGEEWVTTPPHIMILLPEGFDAARFTTDHHSGYPYIMWDGTPYEHLMVPLVAMSREEMGDVSDQLANILASAPAAVAKDATVLGNPETEGGDMVVLQEGTNGWLCLDDRAVSPGNDPSCNDAEWNQYNDDFGAGKEPAPQQAGIAYMLQGGSDESNTDPLALEPPPGAEWISTPHHIMLLAPGGFDSTYFTTDHHSGYPYIMWAGTPYQHLMIPVNSEEMPEMAQ